MNLQEYTVSLQQQKNPKLKPEEIIAKVEEWKKNNTQPEVEEEVVVEETINNDPFGIRKNTILDDGDSFSLYPNNQKPKPISEMTLGEMQTALEPYQAQQEYEKLMYSVAEPEEIYSPDGDPYEYKYSVNPGEQPQYYHRLKDSSDEWKMHEIDSDQGFDIGYKVFNHLQVDDDAYNQGQAVINKTIEGGGAFSTFMNTSNDVLDEGIIPMEDALAGYNIEVVEQHVKNAKPTQEEEVILTQNAADYIDDVIDFSEIENMLSDPYLDKFTTQDDFDSYFDSSEGGFELEFLPPFKKELKKRGLTLEAKETDDYSGNVEDNNWVVKAENGEVYDLGKINQNLDLSGLEEFMKINGNQETYKEMAAQQLAKEMYGNLGSTDQLKNSDGNYDPEIEAAINKKAKTLKFQTLRSELHEEKLENILENDRTDFSFDGLKLLAMFPQHFDNTVVFQSSQQNKSINKYYKTQKDNLTKKEKNLTNFLKNGDDLLSSINAQQLALKKAEYQTPAQFTQANKLLAGLNKQKEDVISLMTEKWDELSEEYKNNPDLEGLINKASRNYGVIPLMVNNFKASTTQIGLGTVNLVAEAYELYGATADAIDNLTDSKIGTIALGWQNPLYGISKAFGITSNIKEWHENTQELGDKYVEMILGDVAEAKSVEELSGFEDYITYGTTTFGQVAPQIIAIGTMPEYGLGLVVSSAMGGELKAYDTEEKESKKAQEEWDSGTGQYKNKPKQEEGESDENFKARLDDFIKLNPRPELVRYNELEKWGGAITTGSLEFATGYFIKIPLSQGKSIVNPLLKRVKTIAAANPTANRIFRNTWSKNFNKYVSKGLEWTGDVGLEGLEEVGVEVGGKLYDRWVLGKDVNLFEGNWDVFTAGAIGGIGFKSIGMFQPFLSPVQTPGDVSDINTLQNEIKEISELMIQNPDMDQKTKDLFNKKIKDKIQAITNKTTESANLYTKFSESDFNELGNLDQRMYSINIEIDQVLNDNNIKVGKQKLIDDLRNEYNKLTGAKNKILEKYSGDGATAGEVFKPGAVVDPVYDIDKLRKGSEVVVDQLGDADIVRFDNDGDFLGGIETLRAEGVEIELAEDAEGNILPAKDQSYGLIATLPDGTKQIVINNASSEVDGVPPADKHEVLHLLASKMDPTKLSKMGEDLYNTLTNDRGITGRIEMDTRARRRLEIYKKQYDDGILNQQEFYEEVMAVTSDGLTRKGIKVKDTGPFLNLVNTFLEAIGYKQSFKDGKKALDFLKSFNKDVMSGEGLSQDTLDAAGVAKGKGVKAADTQSDTVETVEVGDTSDYDSAMKTYKKGDLGGGTDGTSSEKNNLVNESNKLSDKQKAEKQQEFLDNQGTAEVDADGNITVYRVGSIREGTQTPMTTDKSTAEIIAKERADQGLSSDITKTKVKTDDVSVWVGGVEAEVIVDVNSDNINDINDNSSLEQESEVDIQAELDVVNEALDNINKDLESDEDLDFDRSILEDAKKKNERKKKNLENQLERQKTKKSEKPEVSLTPYMGVGNKFKQGETEDGETPAETKKKSEKNFMDFQKSNYKKESESVLDPLGTINDPDARYTTGPLDGIVALDKQLAKIVRDSGEKSVYSWYWQNDGNDNHQEIYQEIENRKEKVKQLALQNSVNELRAKLKDAKGKNKEDIKLAIQETFKVLPAAVRDSEINIYTGKPKKATVKESRKLTPEEDKQAQTKVKEIQKLQKEGKALAKKYNKPFVKSAKQKRLETELAADIKPTVDSFVESRTKALYDPIAPDAKKNVTRKDFVDSMKSDITTMVVNEFLAKQPLEKFITNRGFVRANNLAKRLGIKSVEQGIDQNIDTVSNIKNKTDGDGDVDGDVKTEIETRKAQLPRKTTKFTPDFVSKLGINTEGKTESQINEEVQKLFDKAINEDLKAMPVKTFGETRNIGPAVATLMEKATGMPAKVFTDKSQNIQKKDAESGALTAVKQYLYNNAQRDFNNLPDAFDTATGKANFIPENIKREFYRKNSKGKFVLDKSKGLKDYQDLLGDMDQPVYRATEAQTIKGLIALSLRNRIFEQAVPDPIARKTTGVKFSEKVKLTKTELKKNSEHKLETEKGYNDALKEAAQLNDMRQVMKMLGVPMETINDKNRKTIVDNFVKEIETNPAIISPVLTALNLSNFGARNLTSKDWRTKQGADGPSIKERNEWNAFEEENKIVENAKYYRIDLGVDADGNNKYTFMIAPEIGLDQTKVNQLLKKTNPKNGKKYTLKYIKENKHSLDVVKYARTDTAGFREEMENKFGEKGIDPPPPSFVPARGGMFWGKKDRNYEKAEKLAKKNDTKTPENEKAVKAINAVKRIKIDDKGNYIIPRGINPKTKKAWTKADIDKINQEGRNALLNQLTKAVENGMPFETLAMLVNKGYQGTGAIFKISIPFVGKSTIILEEGGLTDRARIKLAKEGGPYSEVTTEEHSPPVSVNMGQYMVGQARDIVKSDKDGKFTTKEALAIQKAIDKNAVQVLIDAATDAAMNEKGFKSKIVEGQTIKTKNVAWNRINEGNHDGNPSPLEKIELEEGGTAADKTGITPKAQFSKKFKNNPSALNYQQKLIKDNALDPEALNTKDAKDRLNISMPVQVLKNDQVIKNSELNPDIMVKTITAEKMKTVMVNSFKTRVEANKIKKERKGISVFDFDDTLAETKEKVIVLNSDGSITEISASQFAKDAAKLIEQGAEFDFSNFENVAKETKEGPLADLARKRQGKFGSGDIFVLTARPNTAGPAIKAFLKSIGINIPLKNITGLSDGTPQAKADWVLNKTAEGYNDFYFADDSFANVAGVKAVLDAVDVKNKVQQAKVKKSEKLSDEFNQILEEVTDVGKHKKYSDVRAKLEGAKKDGGLTKRVANQFTITPSADDFIGLTYAFRGEGEQGNRHTEWIEKNLIQPYNKAELELMSAKIAVANDFAELKKQFPSLKTKRNMLGILQNPLLSPIGVGPYTKSQAVRVYMWNKQGMEIPGMSKRDVDALVKAVENDNELNVFADEVILIQKDKSYPPPGKNWLAGDMKSDILNGLDKGFRKKLMTEFSENADIIFSEENLNKLEAQFGSKYREALEDSLRRMKSGSNRPTYDGPGSRIVNDMLDWLNASVGVTMFLNRKSGLLQMLSTVNFINWGDNNIYAAAKAFASKEYFPTVLKLLNSPYLVNRRDGLKINVNEAELVDRGRRDGFQGLVSYLLDKGFIFTRIADSLAIAVGGATFFINRKNALLNRVNPDTGKKYTEAEADTKAFEDFYAVAEETQQSSNPSKISQQQASMAGRVFLSFQNITMQFNRKTKKSILDFVKRRKRPGLTQRESDLSNLSNVMYYVAMQNLIFHSLQQALFATLFDEEDEDKKNKNRTFSVINGIVDSLLFGLGFGGAIVSTIKNVSMRMYNESQKKSPDYEDPLWDLFDVSPVIDSKVRRLRQAAKTFSWNMQQIKRRGWSLDNPAYLAVSQIISSFFNIPLDNLMNMMNAGSNIMDNEVRMWQKIALSLGWSPYILNLPYWGRQSTIDREAKEDEQLKIDYAKAVKNVKAKGFTKKIPLSGPNHYIPKGELGVDYMQVERIDGTIQYYVKHKK